ncbi:geranylgeranyl transferase type-2 subunit alpha [Macrobrachium rosenbergii]|uniref:geranylgeranyl transferase type-2 subunit alpha n=1 Tax=Macrobrachium rosenbergii TaxID=79674 RepID=UPI0034D3E881
MHGRLKIKTTAEQAAEKQKEREEKKKLYLGGLTKAFEKRSSRSYDEEGLKLTAQLLTANPDAATLWNFRREILLNMKCDDDEAWTKLLNGELMMVESCLMKNPKSYGAWHHRCWIMQKFPSPPWNDELELCNRYLKLDERNFHCWDYRRFITTGSHQQPEDELKISKQLIERNLSNYSAWHYRSKLLPVVYPPSASTPHPIPVDILIKELKTVVEAVFTDPSDQSPWFFLRWLINRQEKYPRLMQVGYDDDDGGSLICVFSQPLSLKETPVLSINGEESPNIDWFAPNGETFSYVWVTKLNLPSSEDSSITLSRSGLEEKTVTVPAGSTHFVEWMTELGVCGEELSDLTRSTLEDVKENCVTLDELDPDNKWVLLTLVDILWALDARNYQDKIRSYLSQLEALDSLRANYYTDMKSKLAMETSLTKHRMKAEGGSTFKLNGSNLTRIPFSHLLACSVSVDLSHNEITSLNPLKNLVTCRELVLDSNKISDLSPLSGITSLCKLSIANNKIASFDQIMCLKNLCKLEVLDVSSNPICDDIDIESKIKELLPVVKSIKVT